MYGVVWNSFQRCHNKDGDLVIRPGMFVTYGLKHIKIWTLDLDSVSLAALLEVWMLDWTGTIQKSSGGPHTTRCLCLLDIPGDIAGVCTLSVRLCVHTCLFCVFSGDHP